MQDKIQKVLEMAVRAPSGDNCQPWRLVVSPPRVRLYNIPEKDTSLYNFDQKASLIAHGALLENLEIAASAFGLAVSVSLIPETRDPDWIAEVLFSENQDLASDSLFDSIPGRNTNRRPFDSRPLPAELRQTLQQSSEKIDGTKIYLSRDDREKQSLAVQIGQNDRLVFENPHLHRFLFDHIRFNTQEVESSRDGMDMRSFELPLMDRLAFGVLKSWQAVQLINSFGFLSKKLTKQAEKLCLSSSAIAMVTVNGDSASDFVRGGQAMERFWLEATHQGLQLHPMAGVACLINRISHGATAELSAAHIHTVRQIENELRKTFGCGEETIAMLFRIGYAPPGSAISLRKPLSEVAEIKN